MHPVKTKDDIADEIAQDIIGLSDEIALLKRQIEKCEAEKTKLWAQATGEGVYQEVDDIINCFD